MGLMVFIENEFSIVKHAWPTWGIRIPMLTLIAKRVFWMVTAKSLTLICKIWCLLMSGLLTLTHHRVLGECRLSNKLWVLIETMMFSSLIAPTPRAIACLRVIAPLRLRKTWTWDLVMMILLRICSDLGAVSDLTLAMRDVLQGAILQRQVLAPTALAHLLHDPLLW